MSLVRAEIVLPKDYCQDRGFPFFEFATPRPLTLLERDVYGDEARLDCGTAHAFIGYAENARVFGPGFILTGDNRCLLHGLSHANYPQGLETLLKGYLVRKIESSVIELELPDGPSFNDGEMVLLWGNANFGHWIFTHLHRLVLLTYRPELRDRKVVVLDEMPERYFPWLTRLGIGKERVVRAKDGSGIARLWVPSVLNYRGHYDDMNVYTYPEALHWFREQILSGQDPLAASGKERERIYVSRGKAKWRRTLNEEELVARLEQLDVRRIFMEEMSIDEQIDVISRAELIVLPTGGASPITMLAPRDATIIEICVPGFSGIFGSRIWAQMLGQRLSRVDVAPIELDSTSSLHTTIDRDGVVPVDEVVELVEAADGN